MFSLILSLAFAVMVGEVIQDPNISLNHEGSFHVSANQGRYKISKKNKYIEYLDSGKKLYFEGRRNGGKLYRINIIGSSIEVDRYKYNSSGYIDGLTKCEMETSNKAGDNEDRLLCQYMDYQTCRSFTTKSAGVDAKIAECKDVIREVVEVLPSDGIFASRAEKAIVDVSDAVNNLGLDSWEFSTLIGESYRLKSRKDLKEKQKASAMQIFQTYQLAHEICKELGVSRHSRTKSAKEATQ